MSVSETIEERSADENRWKGISYVSYAAGGYLLIKGVIGLASGEKSEKTAHAGIVPSVVPRMGRTTGVELAWGF